MLCPNCDGNEFSVFGNVTLYILDDAVYIEDGKYFNVKCLKCGTNFDPSIFEEELQGLNIEGR